MTVRFLMRSFLMLAVVGMAYIGAYDKIKKKTKEITFVSWGGMFQQSQEEAWALPFTKKTGIRVIQDAPVSYKKMQTMVKYNIIKWDVADMELDIAIKGEKEGLFEPLDFSIIDKKRIDKRFTTKYAVGSFLYSFVLGYRKDKFSTQPMSWADSI